MYRIRRGIVNIYQPFPPPKGHSARRICIISGETKVFSGITHDKDRQKQQQNATIYGDLRNEMLIKG